MIYIWDLIKLKWNDIEILWSQLKYLNKDWYSNISFYKNIYKLKVKQITWSKIIIQTMIF